MPYHELGHHEDGNLSLAMDECERVFFQKYPDKLFCSSLDKLAIVIVVFASIKAYMSEFPIASIVKTSMRSNSVVNRAPFVIFSLSHPPTPPFRVTSNKLLNDSRSPLHRTDNLVKKNVLRFMYSQSKSLLRVI